MDIKDDTVIAFREKSMDDSDWINGGFMVIEPKALDYITGDYMFENEPLSYIAADGELSCYKHNGFWQCMDTMRDKEKLEGLWNSEKAEWKVW